MNAAKRWLATMGGAGNLPAPGTFGSLLTTLIFWGILAFVGPSKAAQDAAAIGGVIVFCVLAIFVGPWAIENFGSKDPQRFVLDEAAGICVTLLLLPPSTGGALAIKMLVTFAMFRVFDITKPPPVRQLEKLPAPWEYWPTISPPAFTQTWRARYFCDLLFAE